MGLRSIAHSAARRSNLSRAFIISQQLVEPFNRSPHPPIFHTSHSCSSTSVALEDELNAFVSRAQIARSIATIL